MNNNNDTENNQDTSEVTPTASNEEEVITPKKEKPEKNGLMRDVFDWIEILVLSLSFVLLMFTFIGRLAIVDGNSMKETLHDREALIISNLAYTPKQGDILVFQKPDVDGTYYSGLLSKPIVKRVIATPGQTVYIDFANWAVYVYDDASLTVEDVLKTVEPLDESYVVLRDAGSMDRGNLTYPYTLAEHELFCMGDNRNHSTDSRDSRIGPVDERYVMGKVLLRITPLDKLGTVN